MPKVEVDEDELVRSRKLRDVVAKIYSSPKAKLLLQQAHKEVDPEAQTPDLDAQKPIDDAISGIKQELTSFINESKKEKQEREEKERLDALNNQVNSGLAALKRQRWTEEGLKGVRELMDKHGILDAEIAASYYEKLHPPATPAMPGGTGAWNFLEMPAEDDVDLKKLIETKGESAPLLDKMVRETLAEMRGQPVRR